MCHDVPYDLFGLLIFYFLFFTNLRKNKFYSINEDFFKK